MTDLGPLWPTRLHHLRLNSDRPQRLVDFYRDTMGLAVAEHGDGIWILSGPDRRLVIGHGAPASLGFAAFAPGSERQLAALRDACRSAGLEIGPQPSPLFDADGFSVRDPEGNLLVFGLPAMWDTPIALGRPARLQHVVVASTKLQEMVAFYRDSLGFLESDNVRADDGELTACFMRSDPEHHSFAVFRAPAARLDHHSYETSGWMDIRDWADHMGDLQIPLWWGPGRHGVGNNLFFMVEDPDGSKVELSAEIEICLADKAAGEWQHGQRALNLWGAAWMRS